MDEVIYKGETPVFEQYGPYIYRETDNWTNVTYDQDLEVTGEEDENFKNNLNGLKTSKALTANYERSAQYWNEGEDQMDHFGKGLDTPLNITNQAAMGVWWGQLNQEKWKFMINLIFRVVNDMGRQLTDISVYRQISKKELTKAEDIMTNFFVDVTISESQATALFTDQIYGLSNIDIFARWGSAFNPGFDIAKSLVF